MYIDKCLWEGRQLVSSLTLEHSKHASKITHWPGYSLCKSTIHTLFTHCSPMVHPLFMNCSPTICQLVTCCLPTLNPHSSSVYQQFTPIYLLFTCGSLTPCLMVTHHSPLFTYCLPTHGSIRTYSLVNNCSLLRVFTYIRMQYTYTHMYM